MISLAVTPARSVRTATADQVRAVPRTGTVAEQFEAALTRLYQVQFPTLYRYLDRTLGDSQLATDIAQEAFIRLYDRGSMPDEPVAWLIT